MPPSKPSAKVVTDTSVELKWTKGHQTTGLNVTLFKVQFKEIKAQKRRKSARWQTIDEDISPDITKFTVSNLKPGLLISGVGRISEYGALHLTFSAKNLDKQKMKFVSSNVLKSAVLCIALDLIPLSPYSGPTSQLFTDFGRISIRKGCGPSCLPRGYANGAYFPKSRCCDFSSVNVISVLKAITERANTT